MLEKKPLREKRQVLESRARRRGPRQLGRTTWRRKENFGKNQPRGWGNHYRESHRDLTKGGRYLRFFKRKKKRWRISLHEALY